MNALERLRIAHSASAAGDALIAVALAGTLFFDVPLGEARAKVALYLLLTMLPFAALSALVGPALDRVRGGARLGIIVSAAGRMILALYMAGAFESLLLYPYAFGVLVLSRAHGLGRAALTPVLAADEPLVTLNARLTRSALLAGTAAAAVGAAISKVSPAATLTAAAGAFAFAGTAAIALPGARRARRAAGEDPLEGAHAAGAAPAAEMQVPSVRLPWRAQGAFIVNAWMRALGAFLLFLLAFALRQRGHGSVATALVLAAAGIGAFAAAALLPKLKHVPAEERVLMVGLTIGAAVCFIAFRSFSYPAAIAVAAIIGATGSGSRVAYDAVLQTEVAVASRGRAFARAETLLQVAWVAGAALPTVIPLPIHAGLLMASIAFISAAIWYAVQRREGPGPRPA